MSHHNYYNRRRMAAVVGRGVIGFSSRRLSPSLGSDPLLELKVPCESKIRAENDPISGIFAVSRDQTNLADQDSIVIFCTRRHRAAEARIILAKWDSTSFR